MNEEVMMSMGVVERAETVARTAHGGQVDKSGLPYIDHPRRVAESLAASGAEDDVVAMGWLHDVVEDTSVTLDDVERLFGLRIRHGVDALTHRHHEPRLDYYARVRSNKDARMVKNKDVDDNIARIPRLRGIDPEAASRLEAKYALARQHI